jgi:gluconate 2-dehydrogenase gamma chain
MESVSLSRRGFLAAAAATGLLHAKPVFFTEAEASLVVLIAEQIIPADQDPGATQARVVQYIDRQLAGPLKRFAPIYREGLPAFDPLRNMPFPEQTRFLEAVERGEHGRPAAELFNLMIDHTMQGFYGSPKHGGNQGEVSWQMLGIVDEMAGGHH